MFWILKPISKSLFLAVNFFWQVWKCTFCVVCLSKIPKCSKISTCLSVVKSWSLRKITPRSLTNAASSSSCWLFNLLSWTFLSSVPWFQVSSSRLQTTSGNWGQIYQCFLSSRLDWQQRTMPFSLDQHMIHGLSTVRIPWEEDRVDYELWSWDCSENELLSGNQSLGRCACRLQEFQLGPVELSPCQSF